MTDEEAVEAEATVLADLKPFNGKQMIVPVMSRACEACGYCVKEPPGDLTCHRMPPQLTYLALPTMQPGALGSRPQQGLAIQNYSGWPIVRRDQWCGEFTQKGRN